MSGEEARRFLEAAAKERFHALYVLGITTELTLKRVDLPDTRFQAATRQTFCCLALQ